MLSMLFSWWGLAAAALGAGGVGAMIFAPGVVAALLGSRSLRPILAILAAFMVGWGLVQWGENRANRQRDAADAARLRVIEAKDREIARLSAESARKDQERLDALEKLDREANEKLRIEREKQTKAGARDLRLDQRALDSLSAPPRR